MCLPRRGQPADTTLTAIVTTGTSTRDMSGGRVADAIDCLRAEIGPASGAVVMGTGIVSVALALEGVEVVSRVLLVAAALSWLALGLLVGDRALRDPDRLRLEARAPAALTGSPPPRCSGPASRRSVGHGRAPRCSPSPSRCGAF
jgi:hypothetical protein